ncbi:MAG: hypothetical protein ACR2ME_02285 [Acidimicrobiia bacterium]
MEDAPESPAKFEFLAPYLNDHWAGAAAGCRLAQRLAAKSRKTSWGGQLAEIFDQIEDDKRSLREIRAALDIHGGDLKRAIAVLMGLIIRLKTGFRGYTPLSRVDELEMLMAGVSSKRGLWVSLQSCAASRPMLQGFKLVELEQRATQQIESLRAIHAEAAKLAFS